MNLSVETSACFHLVRGIDVGVKTLLPGLARKKPLKKCDATYHKPVRFYKTCF
jgi:hypothetical protein